jgi:hypothetical protein
MPHLIELEDLPGFPSVLRKQQVEFIGWLVDAFGIYVPVAPLLSAALDRVGSAEVTDLGSGSGGPIHYLARHPELSQVRFLLTDRYPAPTPTGSPAVRWHTAPVDALAPIAPGNGVLTLFNAFHHFTPAQQQALVRTHGTRGLLVFEVLQPTLPTLLKILFTTTVGQLLLAPFVRPFRWERLLFTYLLPVNLLTIAWDGIVSVVRSSQPATLVQRLQAAAPAGCTVTGGTVGPWWAPVTWVSCLPARRS